MKEVRKAKKQERFYKRTHIKNVTNPIKNPVHDKIKIGEVWPCIL